MVYESPERVIAPWTPDETESLIQYQKEIFAPQAYYCDLGKHHNPMGVSERCMKCLDCGAQRHWAFLLACDWSWRELLSEPKKSPVADFYSGGWSMYG